MELVSYNSSGVYIYEMAARFLQNLLTPAINIWVSQLLKTWELTMLKS